MHSHQNTTQQGFTLIELMVSLTVFAIVMLISTTTLLTMIDMNAKAQALYSATTNLSFAIDSMTREIRMSYHYYCYPVPGGSVGLGSLPAEGATHDCSASEHSDAIAFTRERDGLHKGYGLYEGGLWQYEEGGNGWERLTATDVVIDDFSLSVENTDVYVDSSPHNVRQPVVTLKISGHVNNGLDTNTDFHVQTRIMQRRLDIL